MPHVATARDGSTGALVNGYWACLALACPPHTRRVLPPMQQLWSAAAPDFDSENVEWLRLVEAVSDATEERGLYGLARGWDRPMLCEPLPQRGLRFIIRLVDNRNLVLRGHTRLARDLARGVRAAPLRPAKRRRLKSGFLADREKPAKVPAAFRLVEYIFARYSARPMDAILALEDGSVFRGHAFGAKKTQCGEAVFNTSMTGYQEILTDPSYKGQIVAMTYPQIGNYGINSFDVESWQPHVAGFVVRELSAATSNWRAEMSLPAYLEQNGIPALQGVDTRALTKILRVRGAMKACISTEEISDKQAVNLARQWTGMIGADYVKDVTHPKAFDWDPDDKLSARFTIPTSNPMRAEGANLKPENRSFSTQVSGFIPHPSLPPVRHRIVAFDFGIKYSILRRLRQHGFQTHVVPATASAKQVLAQKPDGIFLSNGPGDPAALGYIAKEVRELIPTGIPIFGICLGHQILGLAFGGKTFKLKFGHRGANQPVKDLPSGKVLITSQNHGFAVDPDSLPADVEVTQLNLNDNTVEGMRHKQLPIFCVQYHPEASPGPHDPTFLFEDFSRMIEKSVR
jgi:carbamoyl-phosphate synthase small subunit